jgi:hypothetical protein
MKTIRHTIGPFTFTFRGDKCWWRYKTKHFGTRITATGSTSISTVDRLLAFFIPGQYGEDGLTTFVNYHLGDLPGANHWAEHYTRCRGAFVKEPASPEPCFWEKQTGGLA